MRENQKIIGGDAALSKPPLKRFLPRQQRDQITSSLERGMVQSRIQQCRLHINYTLIRSREPVSARRAQNRGDVGGRARPRAAPSPAQLSEGSVGLGRPAFFYSFT